MKKERHLPKQNRTCLAIVGALSLLILCAGVFWVAAFYVIGNFPPSAPRSESVPQPIIAISAENIGKVKQLVAFSQRANVTSLAWSPDSRILAAGGSRRENDTKDLAPETLVLWDVTTARALRLSNQNPLDMHSIAFSPDGRWLATGSADGVMLWNVADGNQLRALAKAGRNVGAITFSTDSQTIYAVVSGGESNGIQSWDVATGRALKSFDGYAGLVYTPQGKVLAWSITQEGTWMRTINLSELETGRELWSIRRIAGPMALSHNGEILVWQEGHAEIPVITLTLLNATNGFSHFATPCRPPYCWAGKTWMAMAFRKFSTQLRTVLRRFRSNRRQKTETCHVSAIFGMRITENESLYLMLIRGILLREFVGITKPVTFARTQDPNTHITGSHINQTISSSVNIFGVTNRDNFNYWAELRRTTAPVIGDALMLYWNSRLTLKGDYWLRVLVVDKTGNYNQPCEYHRIVKN